MTFRDPLPLSHDPVAKTVTVGDTVIAEPRLGLLREIDTSLKARFAGPFHGDTKATMQHYSRLLGPKFNRRFHAAQYYTWIEPWFDRVTAGLLKMRGRHFRHYDNVWVERAHSNYEWVKQAERDGLHHLIPIIIAFQKSPKDIRADVGRATWRHFANASKTRNKMLGVALCNNPQRASAAVQFPSGVLPATYKLSSDELVAARIAERKTQISFVHAVQLVFDTKRMLGDNFNPNWSAARIKREHDEASRRIAAQEYSAEDFAEPWSFEKGSLKAELLTSQLEVAMEGRTQRHCVASYAHMASKGKYFVFRITGSERATLGLRHDKYGSLSLDQLYGACNADASRQAHDFANDVVYAFIERAGIMPHRGEEGLAFEDAFAW